MNSSHFKLAELSERLQRDVDVYICCASYEARCKSVADNLPLHRVKRAIVAETEHKQRYVSDNGNYLRGKFGASLVPATLESADPVATADALWRSIRGALPDRDDRVVLVDITTFTHEAMLILIKLLVLHAKPGDLFQFVYVSAAEYSVGDKDDEKWLSKGVGDVRSVLGYPGELLPSRKQHLIVLVGFEHERASQLIKAYEPSVISLGHGRAGTSTHAKHEVANRHFHRLVSAMAATYGEVREFQFACDDPLDAKAAIERQIKIVKGLNTVVAPMNTKISTLGALLAAEADETVQLCYARANQYNYRGYSSPGEECYLIELPELFVAASAESGEQVVD